MEVDMKQFVPDNALSGRYRNSYPLCMKKFDEVYWLYYITPISNQTQKIVGERKYEFFLRKSFDLDSFSFEALGLLQGEMSKTYRNHLTFCNSRPELVNHVLRFFEEKLCVKSNNWKWYIKLNIPSPKKDEHTRLQNNLIPFWLERTVICKQMSYPNILSFIENTNNKCLKNNGTLIIEKTGRIFVQVIQKLVKDITYSMPFRSHKEIIPFMRGIIAAEACINFRLKSGHRRVFITAVDDEERNIFIKSLNKLGIETKDCKPIKDIVISRRENLEKLHQLDLMSLNLEKGERFSQMLGSYR